MDYSPEEGKELDTTEQVSMSDEKPVWNTTYCMTWTIWHSGKSKIMKAIKRLVFARGGGGRDEQAQLRGFLGQWKFSVLNYNDGYICPNP